MANLLPEGAQALSAATLLLLYVSPAVAQLDTPELQPDMPITIDAESTEFNYETSQLVFRGLRMDQGNLGIRADLAETDKLDFADGEWLFSGNVIVEADGTSLYCDTATLRFLDNELSTAVLRGEPARFEQRVAEADAVNSGAANEINYRLVGGTLELVGAARFSDGTNEISGDFINYDLAAQRLTAGSGSSGPVKILIDPATRLPDEPAEPATTAP